MKVRAVILASLCVALGALVGWKLGGVAQKRLDVTRDAERQRLLEAGQVVAIERDDLVGRLRKLEADNSILRDAMTKAKKDAPNAKTVAVVTAATAPLPAQGTEPCLVRPGDKLQLRLAAAQLETRAGNQLLVATLQAWRVTPDGEALLAEGEAREGVTFDVARRDQSVTHSWGIGPAVTISSRGIGYGVTLAPPNFRLNVLEINPLISATYATSVTAVTLSAYVRLYN